MSDNRKPIVGEILLSLNVGNLARHRPQVLTPVRVTMVGRKYFEVTNIDGYGSSRHHLADWSEVSEYSPQVALYESEQQRSDEKERGELIIKIRIWFDAFWGVHCSLSDLREIDAIIKRTHPPAPVAEGGEK